MKNDLKPLRQKEIDQRLRKIPGWKYKNSKITKEFSFNSFSEAVDFVQKLAPFCNNIDHHPDIHIYYKKIVFDLTRFSVGEKVTDRDFTVATEIERLYSKVSNDDKN